jgi:hypothetical protein
MKSKSLILKNNLILREVRVGGFLKDELLQELKAKSISINEFGLKIINHKEFKTSSVRKKLQTAEVSVGDLGFLNGASTSEIYQKATEIGFTLCPAELGLHMRLQYIDVHQPIDPPKGNWQSISMKELSDEPDFPKGLYFVDEKMASGCVVIKLVLIFYGILLTGLFLSSSLNPI